MRNADQKKKKKKEQRETNRKKALSSYRFCLIYASRKTTHQTTPFLSGYVVSALTPFPGVVKVQLFLAAYFTTRVYSIMMSSLSAYCKDSRSPLILSWARISPSPLTSFYVPSISSLSSNTANIKP
ncbi:hypothetical protein M431DRAFT_175973 [Trichoderma harzianum CBS 226.95]|uniref:Uncharacterized protein n=1 Tax=Trichoderma harzianum CBS 226.95 TaxID=983964 RepID=A0A2T4AT78_TRIHA|nr:hypothetical protein M431DRAFT_175973 [Trichoderma harzianum CBS 226.95]PTB60263.1 hypothetical protein M431DRAFT_175973 [Trichoderma harzianum CBS 226.95]